MTAADVDLCRSCETPLCLTCSVTAVECADGGWHCGPGCASHCEPCLATAADGHAADIAADVALTACEEGT